MADTNNHTVRVSRENEGWNSSNLSVVDRARHIRNTGVSWVLKQVLYILYYHGNYMAPYFTTHYHSNYTYYITSLAFYSFSFGHDRGIPNVSSF